MGWLGCVGRSEEARVRWMTMEVVAPFAIPAGGGLGAPSRYCLACAKLNGFFTWKLLFANSNRLQLKKKEPSQMIRI